MTKNKTIGVTGAGGFIGRHLSIRIGRQEGWSVLPCPREAFDDPQALQRFVAECDAVVHLAGMNRGDDSEIHAVNTRLARRLADALAAAGVSPHVLFASSTQETCDNAYGRSKREAGEILAEWADETGSPLSILVIPNVYGVGCRPFYNSVVATFCHQLAHGETPEILEDKELELIYVCELVETLIEAMANPPDGIRRRRIEGTARLTVSRLLETLVSFRDHYFEKDVVPDLSDRVRQNLYATFLSHLPGDELKHSPPLRSDDRGSLVEVIKLAQGGQVFFSTTRPGVIRGNHYHTRKIEWFCVLKGEAVIRLRRLGGSDVREFRVSGENPQFITIPVMHTHHIENVGDEDLLTMFWCNEIFDAGEADTYFEKVA